MAHDLTFVTEPLTVYVVAGPNGAGKTTFATEFLPDFVRCREFLNADLIAAGLSPFAPETQNFRAGRLLLTRFRELAEQRESFGFETTLSGRSHLVLLRDLRRRGYRVVLFFLWLCSAELALQRVATRKAQGGHGVPEADVRRRFQLGLRNLFQDYLPVLDEWWIYDADCLPPDLIAAKTAGDPTLFDTDRFEAVRRAAGVITE
jgi:predicted ABC-type ATPase